MLSIFLALYLQLFKENRSGDLFCRSWETKQFKGTFYFVSSHHSHLVQLFLLQLDGSKIIYSNQLESILIC